ncbi:MAG: cadherin-like domain-containing protein, partial [Gammaproteobacteria bacterium]|nr:cadherin-like domain-containing protein [Gammaproteobacteria bacterium]
LANADTATTAEDIALNNIDVLGNDTDDDGDTLSVTGATAANGSVTVNPDGTLNYTPSANFNGMDTVSYDLSDGQGTIFNAGIVNLTVAPVNDAPIGDMPVGQTTSVNTLLVFSSLDGNSLSVADPDGAGAMLEITLTASNGVLSLSSTTGLVFNVGNGTDDATMTFTGNAAAINAALDGLLFQPDVDFEGFATLQMVTDDLGNSGAGGALNAMDSLSISVVANAVVSEDPPPPLDEIIVDYPDLPTLDLDPVPPVSTTTTESSSVGSDGLPGPGAGSTFKNLSSSGDVTVFESIAAARDNGQLNQTDDRAITTRVWNAITDPLVSLQVLAALPTGAMIWDFLDLMTDQITTDDPETADLKGYVLGTTATGVTFAFSAGYVSWLLRAGYLSAALLSSAPMWRQLDPLPILSRPTKKKRGKDEEGQDSTDSGDRKVEDIFNADAHCSSDKEVS